MAINVALHRKRAYDVWPHLVKIASRHGECTSYGKISKKIGVHHRAAGWYLGFIQQYCKKNGLPKLQSLVVNKKDRVPGGGYAGSRHKKAHAKEVSRVHAFPWPTKPPFKRD